jgi:hypothetical protein
MFYVCDVIVLILVSFALCCVRSCACLCFVLFLLVFITHICVCPLRAGSLPAFECLSIHSMQIDVPPLRRLSFHV